MTMVVQFEISQNFIDGNVPFDYQIADAGQVTLMYQIFYH